MLAGKLKTLSPEILEAFVDRCQVQDNFPCKALDLRVALAPFFLVSLILLPMHIYNIDVRIYVSAL